MIILTVRFKSGLPDAELERVMKERMPSFRALPGLLQKYYVHEKETGELAGIYLWDSEDSLKEYRESELARTIPEAYKAQGTPRIEKLEVLHQLRE